MYAELGFGGLHYGEAERLRLHFDYDETYFDELNSDAERQHEDGAHGPLEADL